MLDLVSTTKLLEGGGRWERRGSEIIMLLDLHVPGRITRSMNTGQYLGIQERSRSGCNCG